MVLQVFVVVTKSGDGLPDLIGRTKSGQLYLYPGNGAGGFLRNSLIGNGFNFITFLG